MLHNTTYTIHERNSFDDKIIAARINAATDATLTSSDKHLYIRYALLTTSSLAQSLWKIYSVYEISSLDKMLPSSVPHAV